MLKTTHFLFLEEGSIVRDIYYGFDVYVIDDSLDVKEALQIAIHERGHNTCWNERVNIVKDTNN